MNRTNENPFFGYLILSIVAFWAGGNYSIPWLFFAGILGSPFFALLAFVRFLANEFARSKRIASEDF